MSVYVDDIFTWPVDTVKNVQARRLAERNKGRWSHMIADSEEELVRFAISIGLKKEWLQHAGTPRAHFDLTPNKRKQAVAKGAKELHGLSFSEKWEQLKEQAKCNSLRKKKLK